MVTDLLLLNSSSFFDDYNYSTTIKPHGKTGKSEGGVFSGHGPLDSPLAKFLVQAIIIIGLTRFLHIFLHKLRQPRAIAEIIGGICLGPSVLGNIPGFTATIFPEESINLLSIVANIGLVFYLFLVGLEVEPQSFFNNFRRSAAISASGIILPFVLGVAISWGLYNHMLVPNPNHIPFTSFLLFTGVAMSITAFPLLARILTEKKLMKTPVGLVAISAAAIDDAVAWTLLALVISILNAGDSLTALYVFLVTLAYAILLLVGLRPLLNYLFNRFLAKNSNPVSQFFVAIVFIGIFTSAWITELIGMHAIFGAFLFGLILPRGRDVAVRLTERIEDVIFIGFLPLFFASSGLKTNIGLLNDGMTWAWLFGVIFVACFGKMFGCTITARLIGISWRESISVGVLMNTKGLVELIVLNIGREAGVINDKIFLILVIMALVTTFMTAPIIAFLYPSKYHEGTLVPRKPTRALSTVRQPSKKPSANDDRRDPAIIEREQIRALVCIEEANAVTAVAKILWLFKTGDKIKDQDSLIINTLKIVETSERSSSIIKASQVADEVRTDLGLNMMMLFGNLIDATTRNFMAFSPVGDLADEVDYVANSEECNLIVLPWFEQTVIGSILSSSPQEKIRNIVNSAEPTTAVYVPIRGVDSTLLPVPKKILVPFFGGLDDCEAAKLALRFQQRIDVRLTFLKIDLSAAAVTTASNSHVNVKKTSRLSLASGVHILPALEQDKTIMEDIHRLASDSKNSLTLKSVDQCFDGIAAVMAECQCDRYDLVVLGRNFDIAFDSANASAGVQTNTISGDHDHQLVNGLAPGVLLMRSQSESHNVDNDNPLARSSTIGNIMNKIQAANSSSSNIAAGQRARPTIVTEILGKLGQKLYESDVASLLIVHRRQYVNI